MAIKFQCDVCGGLGPPEEHTHFLNMDYRGDQRHIRREPTLRPGDVSERDARVHLDICQGCNDTIRKAVNAVIKVARRDNA